MKSVESVELRVFNSNRAPKVGGSSGAPCAKGKGRSSGAHWQIEQSGPRERKAREKK